MRDKQDFLPLSFEEAKLEAQKLREERSTFLQTLRQRRDNIRFLLALKFVALTAGISFSAAFFITLGLTIAFFSTSVMVCLLTLGTLPLGCFFAFKVISNMLQEKLNDRSQTKEQNKEKLKALLEKSIKSRWDQVRAIMTKGALAEISQGEKPDPTTAILSRIYYDRERNHQTMKLLTTPFKELSNYQKSPLIAPFMYLLALSAMGQHRRGFSQLPTNLRPEPQLTITLVTNYHVANFFAKVRETTAAFYDKENGIFVSLEEDDIQASGEASEGFYYLVFHEAAHFAALEVMENDSKPYKKNDEKAQQNYLNVITKTKTFLSIPNKNNPDKNIEQRIIERLQSMFIDYPESQHESELFVTVAETIALLGYEKGYAWLKKYAPDLLNFYETRFNPACIQYLKEQRVWEYIEIDPAFSKVLGLASEEATAGNQESVSYNYVFHQDDNKTANIQSTIANSQDLKSNVANSLSF